MAQVVKQLKPEDYEVNEKDRAVSLTEVGSTTSKSSWANPAGPRPPEDVTPEQARLTGYLEQAMRAQTLFHRNKIILYRAASGHRGRFTGRLMPGGAGPTAAPGGGGQRRGAGRTGERDIRHHHAAKLFRMYKKLAGMTGTALTRRKSSAKSTSLRSCRSRQSEYQAIGKGAPLIEVKAKDDENYPFTYYARRDDDNEPCITAARIIRTHLSHGGSELRALAAEIVRYNALGRPMLVAPPRSILRAFVQPLRAESVRRLLQVGLVRHSFVKTKQREEDGRLIPNYSLSTKSSKISRPTYYANLERRSA